MKRTFKEDSKFFDNLNRRKLKCKCGHTITISYNTPFRICNYCGRKVENSREEFKRKLKRDVSIPFFINQDILH